jgi:hypothetical protein
MREVGEPLSPKHRSAISAEQTVGGAMGRLAPQFGHALERVLDLNLCRSAIQELAKSRLCSPLSPRVADCHKPASAVALRI